MMRMACCMHCELAQFRYFKMPPAEPLRAQLPGEGLVPGQELERRAPKECG
jgi:hypothetical protein